MRIFIFGLAFILYVLRLSGSNSYVNYGKIMVEKLTCFKGIKKLKNVNLIGSKTLNYVDFGLCM